MAASSRTAARSLNGDFGRGRPLRSVHRRRRHRVLRKGDDFERITTSLKKENGERALGTTLGETHPAHPLADGRARAYIGPALLFGKHYMTRYEPVKDAAGKVDRQPSSSASTWRVPEPRSKSWPRRRKFFDTGGVYVIDPKKACADAMFVSHPNAKGKKVLEASRRREAFLATLDKAGIARFCRRKAPAVRAHAHRSLGGRAQEQVHRLVGGRRSVGCAKRCAAHWAGLLPFWLMLGGADASRSACALFWMMRRWVAQPLQQLSRRARPRSRNGDLTHSRSQRPPRRDRRADPRRSSRCARTSPRRSAACADAVDSISTASAEIADRQPRPVAAHRADGVEPAADRRVDGAADRHRQALGRLAPRQANQLAASAAEVAPARRRRRRRRSSAPWTRSTARSQEDRRHHRRHRRHRVPDQHPRAQRRGRSRARRRAGPRLRRGRQRSALARAALGRSRQGDQGPDRRQRREGRAPARGWCADAGRRWTRSSHRCSASPTSSARSAPPPREQSAGIGQVNTAVTQLDQMTQQNAALVEQIAPPRPRA